MRLGRSVLAGLVAGAVAGFLVALLRPRGTHPAAPMAPGFLPADHLAPLTEPAPCGDPADPADPAEQADTTRPDTTRPAVTSAPAGKVTLDSVRAQD